MNELFCCIRCKSIRKGLFKLSDCELKALYTYNSVGLINSKMYREVCQECRNQIGDEVANTILKNYLDKYG